MKTLYAIAQFAGHVFSGTIMLVIMLMPALAVDFAVHAYVIPVHNVVLYYVFVTLEYAILLIDSAVFLAYLVVSAWRLVQELLT